MISLLLSLAATLAYGLCSLIAYLRYPGPFSPWRGNLLGQLGDRNLNPHGAAIYLAGCAITGTLTIAFFISLASWRRSGGEWQDRLLLLTQALGAIGGIALFMTAIYPQEYRTVHHFWSGLLFASFAVALLLSPFALRHRGSLDPRLIAMAAVSYALDVLSFLLADTHWIEWATVSIFMVYVWLLGFKTATVTSRLSEG